MITLGTPFALLMLQGATGGSASVFGPFMLELVLIIGIMYFIMVRPQQKQRRQHENALKALKRGDQIVTAGGIVGEVVHIRETSKDGGANRLDDQVTIKSAESRIVVERGRISKITSGSATSSAPSGQTST